MILLPAAAHKVQCMPIHNVLPCPYGHMWPQVFWEGSGGTGQSLITPSETWKY